MNMAAEEAAGGLLCGGKRNPAGVTSPWNAKSQHVATKNRRRGGAWLAKQNRDTAIADKTSDTEKHYVLKSSSAGGDSGSQRD
jgi:hypothetical protein